MGAERWSQLRILFERQFLISYRDLTPVAILFPQGTAVVLMNKMNAGT